MVCVPKQCADIYSLLKHLLHLHSFNASNKPYSDEYTDCAKCIQLDASILDFLCIVTSLVVTIRNTFPGYSTLSNNGYATARSPSRSALRSALVSVDSRADKCLGDAVAVAVHWSAACARPCRFYSSDSYKSEASQQLQSQHAAVQAEHSLYYESQVGAPLAQ